LRFTVHNAFGGSQNLLLDVGDGKLLRLRRRSHSNLSFFKYYISFDASHLIDSLQVHLDGHKLLKDKNVPVPEVTSMKGYEKQFAIVEKLDIKFLYQDYVDGTLRLTAEELKKVDVDFFDFVKRTAIFATIGDLRGDQLAYTNRGWVLLDFTPNTDFITDRASPNVFQQSITDDATNSDLMNSTLRMREYVVKPGLPERIKGEVLKIIAAERSSVSEKDMENDFQEHKKNNSCRFLFFWNK
jgi:hypothetical protein